MAELRVTWIAPIIEGLPMLAALNELGRIQRINRVTVRTSTGDKLTLDDIATVLLEPCDVLVWAGHGKSGGLLLPGRVLVKAKWLAAQVRGGCHPNVAVLAACGSQNRDDDLKSLTEQICRTGINAIGFPTAAEDSASGSFTVELIRALSVDSSVVSAFDVALEFISGNATAGGVFLNPGVGDQPFSVLASLARIEKMLARLETMAITRSGWELPSLLDASGRRDIPAGIDDQEGGIQSLHNLGHIRGLR